jgi:diphthamide synthase (EF-2-diphthine--ammonia ligase)
LTSSRPKALISWSSGKDSALALHEVRRAGEFDVVGALTTVTETFGRVSIHGVRQEILLAQLGAAGLPPRIVPIPYPCPNEIYEARIGEAVAGAVRDGVIHIIFGDLSSPISGPIANKNSPAAASRRCFRYGKGRPCRWRWLLGAEGML